MLLRSLIAFAVFSILPGCPAPTRSLEQGTLEWPADACTDGGVMTQAPSSCNSWSRVGKFPCAQCQGEQGCVDTRMMLYCTYGCGDNVCGAP